MRQEGKRRGREGSWIRGGSYKTRRKLGERHERKKKQEGEGEESRDPW